jgi:hypothetical protein
VREQSQHHLQAAASGAQQRDLGFGVDDVGGQLGGDRVAGRRGVGSGAGGGDFCCAAGISRVFLAAGLVAGSASRQARSSRAWASAFSAVRAAALAFLRSGLPVILVLVSMPAM